MGMPHFLPGPHLPYTSSSHSFLMIVEQDTWSSARGRSWNIGESLAFLAPYLHSNSWLWLVGLVVYHIWGGFTSLATLANHKPDDSRFLPISRLPGGQPTPRSISFAYLYGDRARVHGRWHT